MKHLKTFESFSSEDTIDEGLFTSKERDFRKQYEREGDNMAEEDVDNYFSNFFDPKKSSISGFEGARTPIFIAALKELSGEKQIKLTLLKDAAQKGDKHYILARSKDPRYTQTKGFYINRVQHSSDWTPAGT